MAERRRQIVLLVGPTAGGKSETALALAGMLPSAGVGPGEIVSADSMQVYRGLDIGTAKPTAAERAQAPHHLIDLCAPTEPFSVDRWLDLAEGIVAQIHERAGLPIVVGGTLLYAKAFLEGLFEGPPADTAVRAELAAMERAERRALLERLDPEAAARIHPNDERRTIRALEVHRLTGRPISALQGQWDSGGARAGTLLVGLDWPAEDLSKRINSRVRRMAEAGLVEEVRSLWERGMLGPQAREAIGYKQLVEVFEAAHSAGRTPWPNEIEDALERVKIESRRLAKNQRTWLRRLRPTPRSLWLDAAEGGPTDWASRILQSLAGDGGAPGGL